MTIAAMSVGMNESIIPNIWLMLSRPERRAGEEDHHQHHQPEDQLGQRAHRVEPRAGPSHDLVQPTRRGDPVEVEPLERVVGPALDLPGQEVAGEQDDGRAHEGGQHGADLLGADAQPLPEFVHGDTSMTSLPICSPRCIRSKPRRLRPADDLVHHRPQPALVRQAHDLRVLPAAAHGGAQDAPLMPEEPPQVEVDQRVRWWRRRSPAGPRAGARGASLPGRSPTLSTTTSAPRPPVIRRTSATTSSRARD